MSRSVRAVRKKRGLAFDRENAGVRFAAEGDTGNTENTGNTGNTEEGTGGTPGKGRRTKFSIGGEIGAGRMHDAAVRLQNLARAKEMIREGRSPQSVKWATGWELGGDGKWKFELPDLHIKRKGRTPDGVSYERELFDIVLGTDGKLEEYIDAPELFEAYPELRKVRLVFGNLGGKYAGAYDKKNNTLSVDNTRAYQTLEEINREEEKPVPDEKRIKRLRELLLWRLECVCTHEVQHAIQAIEGFAPGGNLSTVADFEEVLSRQWTQYDAYLRLAGEAEARNAEHRAGFSDTMKRLSLLSQTLDVPENELVYLVDELPPDLQGEIEENTEKEGAGESDLSDLSDKSDGKAGIKQVERLEHSRYQENTMLSADAPIPVVPVEAHFGTIGDEERSLKQKIKSAQGALEVVNDEQKMPVRILLNDSLDESTSEKALRATTADGTTPEIHAAALRNIEQLLKSARLGASHRDWHTYAKREQGKTQKEPDLQIHRFYVAMQYGDDIYGVKMTVREKHDGRTIFYTLEAHSLDIQKISPEAKTSGAAWLNPALPAGLPTVKYSTFFEKFKPIDDLLGFKYKKKYPDVRFSVGPVYTGSAADYDRPSLHFVGTGEGAQVYGWGLYGSSAEDVGRWYAEKDAINKRDADVLWDGKPSDTFFREMRRTTGETDDYWRLSALHDILKDKHGDVDRVIKIRQKDVELAEKFNQPNAAILRRDIQLLEEYRDRIKYRPGAQKTLTINGEEFVLGQAYPGKAYWENVMVNFLFSAEGDVARAMRNVDEGIGIAKYKLQADKTDDYWQTRLADLQKVKAFLSDKSNRIAYDEGLTGRRNLYEQTFWPGKEENLLDWDTLISKEQLSQIEAQLKKEGLQDKFSPSIEYGEELYNNLSYLLGSPKAASEFLYRAGIDGITYIGDTSGVRNYVAFSDQDVRVDDHFRFSMGEADEETRRLVSMMKAAAGYDKTKPGEVYAKKFKEMYGEDIDPKEAKLIAAMAVDENRAEAVRRYRKAALQFYRDSDPAFDFFLNFAGPEGKLNPGRDHLGERLPLRFQRLSEHGENVFVHPVETKIVRVAAVNGAGVVHLLPEKGFAVDEPDVAVARIRGMPPGAADDLAPGRSGRLVGVEHVGADVAHGKDDDRQIRPRFADRPEERLVGRSQVFRRGRVVVVVHDEGGKFKSADGAGNRELAFAAAGKAEIDLLRVEFAAEHGGVGVPRTGGASPLGDGGAVEEDRTGHLVRQRRQDRAAFLQADLDLLHAAVEGEIHHPLAHQAVRILAALGVDLHRAGVGPERPVVEQPPARLFPVSVESHAARPGHVVHVAAVSQFRPDQQLRRVRTEPHAHAGGVVGEAQGPRIDIGFGKTFRQAVPGSAVFRVPGQSFDLEGRQFHVAEKKPVLIRRARGKIPVDPGNVHFPVSSRISG